MKIKYSICLLLMLLFSYVADAFNVTFYVNGQVYSTETVKSGETITLTPPNTKGIDCPFSIYFNAWSTNDDPANPNLMKGDPSGASFSYPKVKVTSDMNFYAMWNLGYDLVYSFDYYTVTVYGSENGTVETTQYFGGDYLYDDKWAAEQSGNDILYKVLKGAPIAFEAKANDGYEFDSWAVGFNRDVQQSDNKVKIIVNSNGVLSASFHEKAPEVDYTPLNTVINEARKYMSEDLKDDKYASVRLTLYNAVEEAESLKTGNKTQAEVDAGVWALRDVLKQAKNSKETIDNAEQNDSSKVSYEALNEKITEARNYVNAELQDDKYDEVRWPLRNAIEEAESLMMFDRTQAEVDAGVKALADALTKAMNDKKAIDDAPPAAVINYDALTALHYDAVNYYYAIYDKSKYADPTEKLLTELLITQDMLQKKNAESQQQVDKLLDDLTRIYGEVKEAVAAIDKAEDDAKSPERKAFDAAYAEAQAYYALISYGYSSIAESYSNTVILTSHCMDEKMVSYCIRRFTRLFSSK